MYKYFQVNIIKFSIYKYMFFLKLNWSTCIVSNILLKYVHFKYMYHVPFANFLTWLLLNLFPEENGFWRTSKGRELLQWIIKKSLSETFPYISIFHLISFIKQTH